MPEAYANREQDVAEGGMLRGGRIFNGRVWAARAPDGALGWVSLGSGAALD